MNLTGLGTGIDTSTIVSQLMEINKLGLNRLQTQRAKWESKQSALTTLETKINSFKTAVTALADSQKLKGFKASCSDPDVLTATAASSGFEGNHTVQIEALASAQRIIHENGMAYAEDRVGQGTFIYSYNHKEVTISTTETTTLTELVGLINNDPSNPGVTASILKYNNKYHLVLAGNQSGAENTISINSSNTNVLAADSSFSISGANASASNKLIELDQFNKSALGLNDKITISGTKPDGTAITPVDVTVTANTTIQRLLDEITAAYGGSATATLVDGKIKLTDNVSGSSLTTLQLNFTPDTGSSAQLTLPTFAVSTQGGTKTADLATFAPATFNETQAATNSKVRVDGFPATGWIERSSNTIDDVIPGVTLDLHASQKTVQVNLTRQTDDFKKKIQALVDGYNQVVTYIKEKTAYDKDPTKVGVLMSDYTVSNIRNMLRFPLVNQTEGFSNNSDSFSLPSAIGFQMDKDGVLSIDSTKLDAAIAKDYLGTLNLVGANNIGSSNNTNLKFYGATDKTAGGSYEVQADFDGSGALTSAKIRKVGETAWRDATISGNMITGSSANDSQGRALYPENGLTLIVDYAGSATMTATVQVKRGFAAKLKNVFKDILASQTGSLQIDQKTAETAMKNLDSRIDRETTRLEKLQKQLIAKYARLESVISQMQSQYASFS